MHHQLSLSPAQKQCTKCREEKPLAEFPRDRSAKDGLHCYCRLCARAVTKRYEQTTTGAANTRRNNNAHKARLQAMIDQIKECVGCQSCKGENVSVALDFHHLVSTEKAFTISKHSCGWLRIVDEMNKCVLLCANCHRKVHAGLIDILLIPRLKFSEIVYTPDNENQPNATREKG
jgi:hypothetical protein